MIRTQAIRAVRPVAARSLPAAARTYVSANPSPPPRQDPSTAGSAPQDGSSRPSVSWDKKQTEPSKSGATMYAVAGITAAGGLWYYYSQVQGQDRTARKRGEEDRVKEGARQVEQAGSARIDEALKDSQRKYEEAKTAAQDQLNAARKSIDSTTNVASSKLDEARRQADARYHEAVDAAARKYSQTRDAAERTYSQAVNSVEGGYARAKGTVEDGYARAKGAAEGGYDRAKGATEGSYDQARGKAEETKDEAKRGWFSWLSWGSEKKDEVKKDALGTFQRGAEKAQAGEEEVKVKAERAK